MRAKIGNQWVDEVLILDRHRPPVSKPPRAIRNQGSLHGNSMIRLSPRARHPALDHIQPVHIAAIRIAAAGEVADVTDIPRKPRIQEIGIQRNNDVGLREIVARLDRLPKGQLRAFENVIAIYWLINMPL